MMRNQRGFLLPILFSVFAFLALGVLGWVALVSRQELERVAFRRSLLAGLASFAILMILAWSPGDVFVWLRWLVIVAGVTFAGFLLVPTRATWGHDQQTPEKRIDERTIMFSRAELEPGTDRFQEYYQQHPEHLEPDDHFRKLAGLMSPQSGKYELLSFAAAKASFTTVDHLSQWVEGSVAEQRHDVDPQVITTFLKSWAVKLGAESAGVAKLEDYHFYSVKGRGKTYGETILPDHKFGLAFTVEMDHHHLGSAPEGPTLMESAQQYLNAGAIAIQLAEFIRQLGYEAEAHIDGNYKVICPLVGRDAGVGELGRMGLLMTPRLGPRVRLGVVTTSLPLEVDAPLHDPTVLEFCALCKKCAEICPVDALPAGAPSVWEGSVRWKLDSEACFSYWCATGTDCGQCMKVCPFSHPDTLLHNVVRRGLQRSRNFRQFALKMDDLLYGRKPASLPTPDWIPPRKTPGRL